MNLLPSDSTVQSQTLRKLQRFNKKLRVFPKNLKFSVFFSYLTLDFTVTADFNEMETT